MVPVRNSAINKAKTVIQKRHHKQQSLVDPLTKKQEKIEILDKQVLERNKSTHHLSNFMVKNGLHVYAFVVMVECVSKQSQSQFVSSLQHLEISERIKSMLKTDLFNRTCRLIFKAVSFE